MERASRKTVNSYSPVRKRKRYSLNLTSPTPLSLSANERKSMRVACEGDTCTAFLPHKTAEKSFVPASSMPKFPCPHVAQLGTGLPVLIFRHSLRQRSNCINDPWRSSKRPVSNFSASVTCTAATTLIMGMITPAVSHVGALAAGGASSKTQRRQGVSLGRIVIVTPYDPTAAP